MLNATTKKAMFIRLKVPIRLKIIVKNKVDRLIMIAKVPAIDKRSLSKLRFLLSKKTFV